MKLAFALCDMSQQHIDELCTHLFGYSFWELNYDECIGLMKFIADIQSLYVQHWIAHHAS